MVGLACLGSLFAFLYEIHQCLCLEWPLGAGRNGRLAGCWWLAQCLESWTRASERMTDSSNKASPKWKIKSKDDRLVKRTSRCDVREPTLGVRSFGGRDAACLPLPVGAALINGAFVGKNTQRPDLVSLKRRQMATLKLEGIRPDQQTPLARGTASPPFRIRVTVKVRNSEGGEVSQSPETNPTPTQDRLADG